MRGQHESGAVRKPELCAYKRQSDEQSSIEVSSVNDSENDGGSDRETDSQNRITNKLPDLLCVLPRH